MKHEEIWRKLHEEIDAMSPSDLFKSVFGYTPEEEAAYTEESFLEELNYLKTFFVNGVYKFEQKYDGEPEASVTKLFWNYISKNARSNYEDPHATFTTYYQELPKYGLRITTIHGQGSIKIVEEFDYSTVEYLARNATRLKREGVWREKERIKDLLRGKPNYLDEVKFSTTIDGEPVLDTGVIIRVYTKKDEIRYLIDSVENGEVIVFYNNEKYPLDAVEVTQYHPDNYDNY